MIIIPYFSFCMVILYNTTAFLCRNRSQLLHERGSDCSAPHTDFCGYFTSTGSKSSGSSRSNREGKRSSGREKDRKSTGSGSGSDRATSSGGRKSERPVSQHSHQSHSSVPRSERSHRSSHHSHGPPGLPPFYSLPKIGSKVYGTSGPPGGPPVRELVNVPPELTGSRQSFQKAMGNPCEFFVDIM